MLTWTAPWCFPTTGREHRDGRLPSAAPCRAARVVAEAARILGVRLPMAHLFYASLRRLLLPDQNGGVVVGVSAAVLAAWCPRIVLGAARVVALSITNACVCPCRLSMVGYDAGEVLS